MLYLYLYLNKASFLHKKCGERILILILKSLYILVLSIRIYTAISMFYKYNKWQCTYLYIYMIESVVKLSPPTWMECCTASPLQLATLLWVFGGNIAAIPVLMIHICCGGMVIVSLLYKSNPAACLDPLNGTMAWGCFLMIWSGCDGGTEFLCSVGCSLEHNSIRIFAPGGLSAYKKWALSNLANVGVLFFFSFGV